MVGEIIRRLSVDNLVVAVDYGERAHVRRADDRLAEISLGPPQIEVIVELIDRLVPDRPGCQNDFHVRNPNRDIALDQRLLAHFRLFVQAGSTKKRNGGQAEQQKPDNDGNRANKLKVIKARRHGEFRWQYADTLHRQ